MLIAQRPERRATTFSFWGDFERGSQYLGCTSQAMKAYAWNQRSSRPGLGCLQGVWLQIDCCDISCPTSTYPISSPLKTRGLGGELYRSTGTCTLPPHVPARYRAGERCSGKLKEGSRRTAKNLDRLPSEACCRMSFTKRGQL